MWLSVVRAPAPTPGSLTRGAARAARARLSRAPTRGGVGALAARRVLRVAWVWTRVRQRRGGSGAPRVAARRAVAVARRRTGSRSRRRRAGASRSTSAHARIAARVPAVLRRLGVADGDADACAVWAALECALKLRRPGRDRVARRAAGDRPRPARGRLRAASGLGAARVARSASRGDYALAWAEEAA